MKTNNPDPENRKQQTQNQRDYRKRLKKAGYIRLEINIPPDVFAKLKPYLRHYRNGAFTGKAIVNLLSEIKFK